MSDIDTSASEYHRPGGRSVKQAIADGVRTIGTPPIPNGIHSDAEAIAKRPQIKAAYAAYPDHILKSVSATNRLRWAGSNKPHPVKTEQLLVADIADEILSERGA